MDVKYVVHDLEVVVFVVVVAAVVAAGVRTCSSRRRNSDISVHYAEF